MHDEAADSVPLISLSSAANGIPALVGAVIVELSEGRALESTTLSTTETAGLVRLACLASHAAVDFPHEALSLRPPRQHAYAVPGGWIVVHHSDRLALAVSCTNDVNLALVLASTRRVFEILAFDASPCVELCA